MYIIHKVSKTHLHTLLSCSVCLRSIFCIILISLLSTLCYLTT
nr:MAG TPA_asm: hypothetical protein [Bacteriophage sp.]